MSDKQLLNRMAMVLTEEELSRLIVEMEFGSKIEVDLHGLNRYQAARLIKNIINLCNKKDFVIEAIHGYNNGTVLKDMIMEEKISERIIDKNSYAWNFGKTYLVVA